MERNPQSGTPRTTQHTAFGMLLTTQHIMFQIKLVISFLQVWRGKVPAVFRPCANCHPPIADLDIFHGHAPSALATEFLLFCELV